MDSQQSFSLQCHDGGPGCAFHTSASYLFHWPISRKTQKLLSSIARLLYSYSVGLLCCHHQGQFIYHVVSSACSFFLAASLPSEYASSPSLLHGCNATPHEVCVLPYLAPHLTLMINHQPSLVPHTDFTFRHCATTCPWIFSSSHLSSTENFSADRAL